MSDRSLSVRLSASLSALAAVCSLLAPEARAQSVVLDFEDLACAKGQSQCEVGDQYVARGYALRYTPAVDEPMSAGLMAMVQGAKSGRKGVALSIRSCDAQATLMANDNQPFDVLSIDLAVVSGDGGANVEFVGQRDDGSEVRHTLSIERKPMWQKLRFPDGFKRLSALRWAQGDCLNQLPHMVDNIAVQRSSAP